jgi:hypothetical protein
VPLLSHNRPLFSVTCRQHLSLLSAKFDTITTAAGDAAIGLFGGSSTSAKAAQSSNSSVHVAADIMADKLPGIFAGPTLNLTSLPTFFSLLVDQPKQNSWKAPDPKELAAAAAAAAAGAADSKGGDL